MEKFLRHHKFLAQENLDSSTENISTQEIKTNTKINKHKLRVACNSKFNFLKLFKYALEGILAFSTSPLVISAFVGLIFCLIAFVAVIVIIVKTLAFGDPVGGWPSLACIIMFVSGIQLLFLGVIGMYLSKLYLEVKKRPVYIIDETEKMRENYDK